MAVPRYLYKFTNSTMTSEFVFPRTHYEFSITQGIRNPRRPIINSSYALQLRGQGTAVLKDVASAHIRFLLSGDSAAAIDAIRDEMNTKLTAFTTGYLFYTNGDRALASLKSMPEIEITYESPMTVPVILIYDIWEDFHS